MSEWLDPSQLIKSFGYLGIFLVVFLESGVIFGFFLPGDSLLFLAGLLASQGHLNLAVLIFVVVVAAILGNNVGYYTGKKAGPRLFRRPDSFFLSHKRVEEANKFFAVHGGKSLIIARFIPAGRTLIPIIAGVGKMEYKRFFFYNAIGGLLWGISLPVLGYTLGKTVPDIDKYLLPAIVVIVLVSISPGVYHYIRSMRRS